MPRDKRLSLEQSKTIQTARVLGVATAIPVVLADDELVKVVSVVFHDTGHDDLIPPPILKKVKSIDGYYDLPMEWFEELVGLSVDFTALFLVGTSNIPDFVTYFGCLCSLHKRRKKYARILAAQPLPTMLQVSPRSLLEFGIIATPALASWITWRKWFFDIDNRAGQETGYLFEPILASALGGTPFSAKKSPVKRIKDGHKARQVDCIVGTTAYEFKLRVTIAASGQGRFAEELDFAADCEASGFTPVLMVLDPTPSSRLTDLAAEFRKYGGDAYIGDEAWQHIEAEGGKTMATFIEKYVRRPIEQIDKHADELLNLAISAAEDKSTFSISMGNRKQSHQWEIARREDPSLASGSEDEPE
ncbi:MAG: hypothetical protein WEB85_06865 [Dongiaceae bacterium]